MDILSDHKFMNYFHLDSVYFKLKKIDSVDYICSAQCKKIFSQICNSCVFDTRGNFKTDLCCHFNCTGGKVNSKLTLIPVSIFLLCSQKPKSCCHEH